MNNIYELLKKNTELKELDSHMIFHHLLSMKMDKKNTFDIKVEQVFDDCFCIYVSFVKSKKPFNVNNLARFNETKKKFGIYNFILLEYKKTSITFPIVYKPLKKKIKIVEVVEDILGEDDILEI